MRKAALAVLIFFTAFAPAAAQTPAPSPGAAPTPVQIFVNAFRRLQSYPVAPYAVYSTVWRTREERLDGGPGSSDVDAMRYALRESDAMENAAPMTSSGKLPEAEIFGQFIGLFAWSVRDAVAPPSNSHVDLKPDFESGMKVIATVTAVAKPDYDIDLAGIENLDGHRVYHLRLRPAKDAEKHNLRDLWIDTTTYDIWKVHFDGRYAPDATVPASFSDATVNFAPVGPYWINTHAVWTYTLMPSAFTFDVSVGRVVFPTTLPDWVFDPGEYTKRQQSGAPDLIGDILNGNM